LGQLCHPRRIAFRLPCDQRHQPTAQADLARARVRELGLDSLVDVVLCDYRDLRGSYDKVVSIEMIEAVGWGRWKPPSA
jgi:Mycolic acid cyclopropane synthetase